MAKIQFLTILLTVTCFLGGVISVTDTEFEDLVAIVRQQQTVVEEQSQAIREQARTNERQSDVIEELIMDIEKQSKANELQSALIQEQSVTMEEQSATIYKQSVLIQRLREETRAITEKMKKQDDRIEKLESIVQCEQSGHELNIEDRLLQNATIEERVALLEIQVEEIEGDVTLLEGDVNFLFDETVIQDERLFSLEQTTDAINAELIAIDEEFDTVDSQLEDLQTSIVSLDFRVTILEENGGNSSVAELEVRVETLEGTAADHETRISTVETDVNDLEDSDSDQETRLTTTKENIQGLQMTDMDLDERVTTLEEDTVNATVAFYTALTSYSTIPDESVVLFNEVLLNEGNGYNSTTGTFTVPSGGDGFYYFSVYLRVNGNEWGQFNVELNGELFCTVFSDLTESPDTDSEITTCSGVSYASEGDMVQVVYKAGTDMTPLIVDAAFYYNGFTGFRI